MPADLPLAKFYCTTAAELTAYEDKVNKERKVSTVDVLIRSVCLLGLSVGISQLHQKVFLKCHIPFCMPFPGNKKRRHLLSKQISCFFPPKIYIFFVG